MSVEELRELLKDLPDNYIISHGYPTYNPIQMIIIDKEKEIVYF